MPYPEFFVEPMRLELTRLGVEELRTPEQVDAAVASGPGTLMIVVNSVCGCAAGKARPGIALALQHSTRPDRVATVFAGADVEATDRARQYFTGYAPSSPSIGILRDGKLVYILERRNIENRDASSIAGELVRAFDKFCRIASVILLLLTVSACSSSEAGPQATVLLKDGTSVTGTVASTTASEIRITGEDKVTHAISMSQVRSVEYGDTPAPEAAPGAAASGVASSAPTMASSAARTAPVRKPVAVTLPRPTTDDITTETHVLPAGTEIAVQTDETIDGSTAADGQTFAADVTAAVRDEKGGVVIPAGAKAQVIIKSLTQGGKIRGQGDLVLDLASVSIDGRQYALSTADLEEKGRAGLGKNRRTVEFVGGGAAIGSVVGALLGGGKGAAIGAGIGAGSGTAAQALTKGDIRVEAETILTFKLDAPLRVVERRR